MTEFQQQKLIEYNLILSACYGKRQMLVPLKELMPHLLSRDAIRKKLEHLISEGLLTVYKKCWYESNVKEYPYDKYLAFIDEKQRKQASAALKSNEERKHKPLNKNTTLVEEAKPSLADAIYVHKMERYSDKYHKQARDSQADRKSPRVDVGNMWGMMV